MPELHGERIAIFISSYIDKVGNDRRCRWSFARARALKEQAAHKIALGNYPVQRAGDMGKRMAGRHQHWMNALKQPVFAIFRYTDQTDAISQRCGFTDVRSADITDTGYIHAIEVDLRTKGKAGENRKFVCGIDAVDIESRVGLGITQRLSFGQNVVEIAIILLHG